MSNYHNTIQRNAPIVVGSSSNQIYIYENVLGKESGTFICQEKIFLEHLSIQQSFLNWNSVVVEMILFGYLRPPDT